MAREFKLPDLGEGIHEGEVVSVLVSVGDEVSEGDPILEVETDKAAVEIPSPFTGVVEEIRVEAGDVVNVGDVLVVFSGASGGGKPPSGGKAESSPADAKQLKTAAVSRDRAGATPETGAAVPSRPADRTGEARDDSRPVPASPATRRLARELGVDIRRVSPGGPAGRVTAADVRKFAEAGESPVETPERQAPPPADKRTAAGTLSSIELPELPDFSRWGPVHREKVRSIRRATARHMAVSWSQIPHVTSQDEADITELESLRQRHKADVEKEGGRLTLSAFILKAAAAALRRFPRFNASLDPESDELIVKDYCHIGVAVDTEDGLIVPVLRDVDKKSISELAVELTELAEKTRQRKASLEEMQGASFTLTNIGALGGGFFTPVINHPQVAILGTGAANSKPVVRQNHAGGQSIVPRLMLPMVVAIDHRVLDGADAVRFLRTVIDLLEDPEKMLMRIG